LGLCLGVLVVFCGLALGLIQPLLRRRIA
jgi:hypothetical protein